jgi:predicted nucleic acid-binding protein
VADPTAGVLYADTSALVKLVIREAESDAVEVEVSQWDRIATSDIASIELPRATALARARAR